MGRQEEKLQKKEKECNTIWQKLKKNYSRAAKSYVATQKALKAFQNLEINPDLQEKILCNLKNNSNADNELPFEDMLKKSDGQEVLTKIAIIYLLLQMGYVVEGDG